jgi:NADH:ubiquinone oxidoreductase subunit 6 (subunit J)
MELVAFVALTALAFVSGVVVVTHKNQIVAALALAAILVAIAGFYLLLQAQFLALVQVIVYAGAIMVLVLFVIMLLNLPDEARRHSGRACAASCCWSGFARCGPACAPPRISAPSAGSAPSSWAGRCSRASSILSRPSRRCSWWP